jgi:hypothetical protein
MRRKNNNEGWKEKVNYSANPIMWTFMCLTVVALCLTCNVANRSRDKTAEHEAWDITAEHEACDNTAEHQTLDNAAEHET